MPLIQLESFCEDLKSEKSQCETELTNLNQQLIQILQIPCHCYYGYKDKINSMVNVCPDFRRVFDQQRNHVQNMEIQLQPIQIQIDILSSNINQLNSIINFLNTLIISQCRYFEYFYISPLCKHMLSNNLEYPADIDYSFLEKKYTESLCNVKLNNAMIELLLHHQGFTEHLNIFIVDCIQRFLPILWNQRKTIATINYSDGRVFFFPCIHARENKYLFYFNILADIYCMINLFNLETHQFDYIVTTLLKCVPNIVQIRERTIDACNDICIGVRYSSTYGIEMSCRTDAHFLNEQCKDNYEKLYSSDLQKLEMLVTDWIGINIQQYSKL